MIKKFNWEDAVDAQNKKPQGKKRSILKLPEIGGK